jgi:hypothetical protein
LILQKKFEKVTLEKKILEDEKRATLELEERNSKLKSEVILVFSYCNVSSRMII